MEQNRFVINPIYNFHFRQLFSFFVMSWLHFDFFEIILSIRLVCCLQELNLWLLQKMSRGSFVCHHAIDVFTPVKRLKYFLLTRQTKYHSK